MKFEFDLAKSKANQTKHGIDFKQAEKLWQDPNLIDPVPGDSILEFRWLALGEIDGVLWTAAYTVRGDIIRVISVRRARTEEKEIYYEG